MVTRVFEDDAAGESQAPLREGASPGWYDHLGWCFGLEARAYAETPQQGDPTPYRQKGRPLGRDGDFLQGAARCVLLESRLHDLGQRAQIAAEEGR